MLIIENKSALESLDFRVTIDPHMDGRYSLSIIRRIDGNYFRCDNIISPKLSEGSRDLIDHLTMICDTASLAISEHIKKVCYEKII